MAFKDSYPFAESVPFWGWFPIVLKKVDYPTNQLSLSLKYQTPHTILYSFGSLGPSSHEYSKCLQGWNSSVLENSTNEGEFVEPCMCTPWYIINIPMYVVFSTPLEVAKHLLCNLLSLIIRIEIYKLHVALILSLITLNKMIYH